MIKFLKDTILIVIISFIFGGVGALSYHFYLTGTLGYAHHSRKAVYIPRNLDECFVELKKLLKPEDIQSMQAGSEDDMALYHHGLGTWIRNNWGLWEGSRLSVWFQKKGIEHPDIMSGIILTSFWRHLNGKPIGLEEQFRYYRGDGPQSGPEDESDELTAET